MRLSFANIAIFTIPCLFLSCRGNAQISVITPEPFNINPGAMPGCTRPVTGSGGSIFGSYNTPGAAYDAVVSGNYLFVADNASGVQILNISTPSSPTLVSTFDTSGEATRLVKNGNYLYVADGLSQRVVVINVSNPAAPVLANNLMHITASAIYGIYIQGNYLYVVSGNGAAGSSRLFIWDISNPASPIARGVYTASATVRSVFVWGNYAYLAEGTGLRIVDVSNPNAPASIAFLNTTANVLDVAVSGSYAYLANHAAGVSVVNISTPATPMLVTSQSIPGNALQVKFAAGKIYAAAETGLRVLSVSSSQVLSFEYDLASKATTQGVFLDGSQIILSEGADGIKILYTSELPPAITTSVAPGTYWGPVNLTMNQDIPGDIYYTTNGSDPQICALKYSTGIVLEGNMDLQFFSANPNGAVSTVKSLAYSVQIPVAAVSPASGHFTSPITLTLSSTGPFAAAYYYTTDGSTPETSSSYADSQPFTLNTSGTGTLVFRFFSDFTGPRSPVTTATYTYDIPLTPTASPVSGIFIGSRLVNLYSTDGNAVHYTLDGTNPTTLSPLHLSSLNLNTPGLKNLRFLAGTGASYSATAQGRYMILPTGSGYNYWTDFSLQGSKIAGNYAYVTGCEKVAIVDISATATPVVRGSLSLAPGECGNAIETNATNTVIFVKIATTLRSYDVSQPANPPVLLGTLNLPGSGQIKRQGNYLYLAASSGILIVNVANPAAMSLTSSISLGFHTSAVAVSGDHLYTADDGNYFRAYNINNPASPILTAAIFLGTTVTRMDISGNNLVLASDSLRFFDITAPETPVARGTYPAEIAHLHYNGNTVYAVGPGAGYGGVPPGNTGAKLYQIDVSNISAPALIQEMNLAGRPAGVHRVGSVTYAAVQSLGIFPAEYGGALYGLNLP